MGVIKKSKVKDLPQIIAILVACLNSLTCGILLNWPSPSIPILITQNDYLVTTLEMASYLTVIPSVATVISAFPAYSLVDNFGRKNTLLLTALPHLLSWILIAIGNSIWILYASRFLTGIADTLIFATLPVYIAEIATPKVRSLWGNAMPFSSIMGGFVMNLVGTYLSIRETAYVFGIIPIVFFTVFTFMPESPYYFIIKGRAEEAKTTLRRLRGKDDVEVEYKEIASAVSRQLAESGSLKDLFVERGNRRAVVVGGMLKFTQQFSGILAFSVYSQYIFNKAGGDISGSTSAIVLSGIFIITNLLGSIFVDRVGGRKAVFISGMGCIIMLFAIGIFFNIKDSFDFTNLLWFPILGMIVFLITYCLGLGMVPTLMSGEIFSSSIKSKAIALMNVIFGLCSAVTAKLFQLLESNFGLYAPFYFYGITCLFGTIICYRFMPDTKGKTLEEIQLELKGLNKDQVKSTEKEVVK